MCINLEKIFVQNITNCVRIRATLGNNLFKWGINCKPGSLKQLSRQNLDLSVMQELSRRVTCAHHQ